MFTGQVLMHETELAEIQPSCGKTPAYHWRRKKREKEKEEVRETLLLLLLAQENTEWTDVFGGGDLSCVGKGKWLSMLLAVPISWNTAGETHFSLSAPRVLRWEFCDWEETDPNFKWCQRVCAHQEVLPQSLGVPHPGIPLLGPPTPPKHTECETHTSSDSAASSLCRLPSASVRGSTLRTGRSH